MNKFFFLLLAASYLVGSIPFAVLISKVLFGKDVRNLGSGNAGATNMARNFGKKVGLVTLILDVLKGALPPFILLNLPGFQFEQTSQPELAAFLVAYATGLGHIYPIFAGFKGGKGVATLLGSMLVIQPALAGIGIFAFVISLQLSKYVSLSSMLSAFLFAFLFSLNRDFQISSWVVWGFPALFVFTHRSNIQRLIHGNENKTLLLKMK
ncbi:MAG: glycerol-3-phosphate 1-O-acyltransferase PlsY [Bacteroidetes bacterium]|nr:glycerol-3-phosphate 1-O-acyltransferase PlsY [Bacteroidota bacterium]